MFLKLCKNELKSSYRSFLVLYAIIMISAILLNLNDEGLFSSIMAIIYIVVLIALCIMCIVVMIRNYHVSMFTRNAYLTHTLPVSSTQLLLSKVICSAFWYIMSSIVFILSFAFLVVRALNFDWEVFFDGLSNMIENGALTEFLLYLIFILISAIEFISLIYLVMNSVHTKYIRKFRFVVGILLYIILSSVVDYVFNDLLMSLFGIYSTNSLITFNYSITGNLISYSLEMKVFFFSIAKSLIVSALYFLGSKYILDHKMEIE